MCAFVQDGRIQTSQSVPAADAQLRRDHQKIHRQFHQTAESAFFHPVRNVAAAGKATAADVRTAWIDRPTLVGGQQGTSAPPAAWSRQGAIQLPAATIQRSASGRSSPPQWFRQGRHPGTAGGGLELVVRGLRRKLQNGRGIATTLEPASGV